MTNGATTPSPSGAFYGWTVAYALCAVSTATAGLVFYNISVLLDAFVSQRGFPVALAGLASGLFFAGSGISGVIAGTLIERVDARIVICVSASISALALGCAGLISEPWHLIAFYLVFGFCYGGCGLVPAASIVARWFHAQRAQALAIASTGLSLGGIVATPLSALMIKEYGLSAAAPWIGFALFLGVVPVTAFLVRARPQDLGLEPDGAARNPDTARTVVAGATFATAWRSRVFWAVTISFLFVLGAQVGGIAHIFRLSSVRADAQVAALAVSLMAAASLAGRLASGRLLRTMPLREFTLAAMVSQTAMLAALAFATTPAAILIAVALFGLTAGTILMMQQLLLADAFGAREYGRIYAVSILLTVPGVACGPSLMGWISQTSGYAAAFLTAFAASAVGIGVLLAAPRAR